MSLQIWEILSGWEHVLCYCWLCDSVWILCISWQHSSTDQSDAGAATIPTNWSWGSAAWQHLQALYKTAPCYRHHRCAFCCIKYSSAFDAAMIAHYFYLCLWAALKGMCLMQFHLPSVIFMHHLCHICNHFFIFAADLNCILNTYHITISCHLDLPHFSVYHNTFIRPIKFIKLLSHQQGSSLSPWCCPMISVWLPIKIFWKQRMYFYQSNREKWSTQNTETLAGFISWTHKE